MSIRILSVSFALLLIATLPAYAATINSNSNSTGFTVAGDDLLEGLSPVIATNIGSAENLSSDTTGNSLTNGAFSGPNIVPAPGPNPETVIVHNGTDITYNLSAPASITDINVYSLWRDGGRVNQNYDIHYTTTGNPNFQLLTAVDRNYSGGNPSNLEVLISDVGLSDVRALSFRFRNVQNGFVGYTEIDVLGNDVPEPTSLALAALALLGLFGFSRRRHR